MKKTRYTKVKEEKMNMPMPMTVMLHLPIEAIPEAKDWKPGTDYEIEIKVTMKSLSDKEAIFEVIGVAVDDTKTTDNKNDQ